MHRGPQKEKFGKYKAMLDVSCGQRGTMQDVVYFWVVPWTRMFGFIITVMVVMIITMLFIRSRQMSRPAYSYENYNEEQEDEELKKPVYNTDRLISKIPNIQSKSAN